MNYASSFLDILLEKSEIEAETFTAERADGGHQHPCCVFIRKTCVRM